MKVLDSQIEVNGQCSLQFHVNELQWDKLKKVTLGSMNAQMNAVPIGEVINIQGGELSGFWLVNAHYSSSTYRHFYDIGRITSNGKHVVDSMTGNYILTKVNENGWGDDSKIKPVLNGLYTNTNGEPCIEE